MAQDCPALRSDSVLVLHDTPRRRRVHVQPYVSGINGMVTKSPSE